MQHITLDEILQRPGVRRGREKAAQTGVDHVSSGFPELDLALPGNGWPLGALTEVLHGQPGIGELRLLMPALARLSRQNRWIALIAPPYMPFAQAMAAHGVDLSRVLLIHPRASTDTLWAVEQALRGGNCAAVLAWSKSVDEKSLRRLQVAAETGKSWGLLFRADQEAGGASPAPLRLELTLRGNAAAVRLLKCRGGNPTELLLDLSRRPTLLPRTERPAPVRVARVQRLQPRAGLRGRQIRPLRRPPQMDLPLTVPVAGTETRPLRQDKPGILTWLWRR